MMKQWLIIYDIRNEKRLRKIAKIMIRYGVRVQKSVFEMLAEDQTVERLRKEAKTILQPQDPLTAISLCNACWQKKRQYGIKEEGIGWRKMQF